MRWRFSVLAAGGALLLAVPGAWGATATFNVGASCMSSCSGAGMSQGDLVIGQLEISTDGFAPSGAITRADLVSFGIAFGSTGQGVFRGESPGYAFNATWGSGPDAIDAVSFTASGAGGLTSFGPFLSFGPQANVATTRGACNDVNCASTDIIGAPAVLGPARFTPRDVAPIPLPATAPLAAMGALALAAMARLRGSIRRPRPA